MFLNVFPFKSSIKIKRRPALMMASSFQTSKIGKQDYYSKAFHQKFIELPDDFTLYRDLYLLSRNQSRPDASHYHDPSLLSTVLLLIPQGRYRTLGVALKTRRARFTTLATAALLSAN